jgi:hypothetical protein
MKPLTAPQKVVLIEYLVAVGLPPWANGIKQHRILMALTDMTEEQAIRAYEEAHQAGWIEEDK